MKSQPPTDADGPELRVTPTDDDRWTWRYNEPATDLTLHSNETFASRDVAMDWARRAYPDVPFADDEES